jgi:hypothetical protein
VDSASIERRRATELWQRLLQEIPEHTDPANWQAADQAFVVRQLQALYAVGDRPGYNEVKDYLEEVWPDQPDLRKRVRTVWRKILRNPYHRFRVSEGPATFDVLDRLATQLSREYGSPPLSWRMLGVLDAVWNAYRDVAIDDPNFERYLAARRDVRAAMEAVSRLRATRHGWASIGAWQYMDINEVSREQIEEWSRLRRTYGSR